MLDVLDDRHFRARACIKTLASVNGKEFEIYFFYDPQSRVSESRVVFEDVVERHRRIPIEKADMRYSASKAGLEVKDCFATNYWLTWHVRNFYVLQKPV